MNGDDVFSIRTGERRERLRVVYPDVIAFLCFFVVVVATKIAILETPYYWDEGGWAMPAHSLSRYGLVRALPGFRPADMFWGHPPGLYVVLASLFKVFGESRSVAHMLAIGFAVLGVYFTYRLGSYLYDRATGAFAALALFFSPIYFAQSGMFLADLPVAALGVAAAYFALRDAYRPYLAAATSMVLFKETAAAIIATIVVFRLLSEWRSTQRPRVAIRDATLYGLPLLVLAAFLAWQKAVTGELFFIYRHPVELVDIGWWIWVRKARAIARWVLWDQSRFLLTAAMALALWLVPSFRTRKEIFLCAVLFVAMCFPFVFLYYLRRYVLPLLPFVYVLGMGALTVLIRQKSLRLALQCGVVVLSLLALSQTELRGNGEWNMSYRDVVSTSKTMYRHVATRYPDARVLAAWPDTLNLELPYFGYVDRPMRTVRYGARTQLADFDVAIHSRPSDGAALDEYLHRLERSGAVDLVERIEKGGIVSELYVKHRARRR